MDKKIVHIRTRDKCPECGGRFKEIQGGEVMKGKKEQKDQEVIAKLQMESSYNTQLITILISRLGGEVFVDGDDQAVIEKYVGFKSEPIEGKRIIRLTLKEKEVKKVEHSYLRIVR